MKKIKFILTLTSVFFLGEELLRAQTAPTETTVTSNTVVQTAPAPVPTTAAKDEGVYSHTRFGIRISPSYNSFNVLSKTMTNQGGLIKFGAGLLMETRLTKNVEFQTGIGVDVFGGKITYSNDPSGLPTAFTNRYLYDSPEEEIVDYEVKDRKKAGFLEYMLMERTYKITYITVPVNLRMKTNDINGFKYFGQIGLDFQFRWSAYANDRAQLITGSDDSSTVKIEMADPQDLSKVKINSDVSFMNVAVNTGIGVQYEIGGVDLFLALNYHFGVFSPVDKETSFTKKVYQTSLGKYDATELKQNYRTRVFALTLGFMF